MSINAKPLKRSTDPYFTGSESLPGLPQKVKEMDPRQYKKYDGDIREWWAEIQQNLDRVSEKILNFEITDLETKQSGALTTAQVLLQTNIDDLTSVMNAAIDAEAAARAAADAAETAAREAADSQIQTDITTLISNLYSYST